MDPRSGVAFLLLALLGGGLWWVAAQAPAPGASGVEVVAYVVAPDGSTFANGTVHVAGLTPLSALQSLASLRGFQVGVESATGFSGCSQAYVRSIGPYAQTTTGGWNYYTRRPGEGWAWQAAGAGCGLPAGVEVEWCWVELDVCHHHVA